MPDEKTISSLMSPTESEALDTWAASIARNGNGDEWACEIGCYHGFSTAIIAKYFRTWAIDLGGDIFHGTAKAETIGTETSSIFRANMVELGLIPDRVVQICGTSDCLSLLPTPIFRFVLVDADHSYEWCSRDLINLARVTKDYGIMAIHDYLVERDTDQDYGVRDATDDFLRENPEWRVVSLVESLLFVSRNSCV